MEQKGKTNGIGAGVRSVYEGERATREPLMYLQKQKKGWLKEAWLKEARDGQCMFQPSNQWHKSPDRNQEESTVTFHMHSDITYRAPPEYIHTRNEFFCTNRNNQHIMDHPNRRTRQGLSLEVR